MPQNLARNMLAAILIFPSRLLAFWIDIQFGIILPEQHTVITEHMDHVVSKAQFTKILPCLIICRR
jgi:hypothetical protein